MQILEAALAFAITMLVLSLISSSFVELIHRFLTLRETGLKYLLEQMFDQVLVKYVTPAAQNAIGQSPVGKDALEAARQAFVESMRANRSPGGGELMATLDAAPPAAPKSAPSTAPESEGFMEWLKRVGKKVGLLGGGELTGMTPAQFMERLGSISLNNVDLPELLKNANVKANQLAEEAGKEAGQVAAGAVDAVLKDVAQKFEAIGKEASAYFEGRARLLSVLVAIVLAFAINIDAITLFNTFLRDPNVRTKVIEQSQAVTAQHRTAQDALANAQKRDPNADVEKLKQDLKDEIEKTRKSVAQLTDLGVPIGWDKATGSLNPWAALPVCVKAGAPDRAIARGETCAAGETQKKNSCWDALKLLLALLLGGILVGLGGPFWYDAVVGLTNIRGIAGSVLGTRQPQTAGTPLKGADGAVSAEKPQPQTPVDIFEAARAAREAIRKALAPAAQQAPANPPRTNG